MPDNVDDMLTARARRLGVNTHLGPGVVLRADSPVCHAEGLRAYARIEVPGVQPSSIATLDILTCGELPAANEASLLESAWLLPDALPAGAAPPQANCAGMRLDADMGERVGCGQLLFTQHAESQGELAYATDFVQSHTEIAQLED